MRLRVYTTMLGVLGVCFAAGAGNLIANPSFEEGKNGAPVGWLRYRMEPEQLFYGERNAREGRFCVGVGDKKDKLGAGWMSEAYIRVEPGKTYRLSGWIKAENAWGGNAVCASLYTLRNGRPLWLKTEYSPSVDGVKPWTPVECVFSIPEHVEFVKVGAIRRHASPGMAYFDALALETDSPGDTAPAPETALPRPDWSRAVAAENPPPGKLLREQGIPAAGWTRQNGVGGELGVAGEVLSISDTALPGVGWLSPPFPVEPGRIYALAATVSIRNAWHVRLAAIQYGDDGRILEIRQGDECSGDRVAATLLCRPAKGAKEIRFAVVQSRSSGRSEFEKMMFRCFEGIGE